MAKNKTKPLLGVVAVLCVVLLVTQWGNIVNFFAPEPTSVAPEEVETEISFAVLCYARSMETGAAVHIDDVDAYDNVDPDVDTWYLDVSEMTVDGIEEAVFTDFTIDETGNAEAVEFTPAADRIYAVNITATGFSVVWSYYLGSASSVKPLFMTGFQLLALGSNNIYIINNTASIGAGFFNSTHNTIMANNLDDDYTVMINFDSNDEGIAWEYCADADQWSGLCVFVTWNSSAAASNRLRTATSEVDPIETAVTANQTNQANSSFLFFGGIFYGNDVMEVTFDLHLIGTPGTDYAIVSMSVGKGSPDDVAGDVTLTLVKTQV